MKTRRYFIVCYNLPAVVSRVYNLTKMFSSFLFLFKIDLRSTTTLDYYKPMNSGIEDCQIIFIEKQNSWQRNPQLCSLCIQCGSKVLIAHPWYIHHVTVAFFRVLTCPAIEWRSENKIM